MRPRVHLVQHPGLVKSICADKILRNVCDSSLTSDEPVPLDEQKQSIEPKAFLGFCFLALRFKGLMLKVPPNHHD